MGERIISFDFGTGGNKASLYDFDGNCLGSFFVSYKTYYPQVGWHEQCPDEWWDAIVKSTRGLLEKTGEKPENIECIAISGHSLGAVPIDKDGNLLRKTTPIWSDVRAEKEAQEFFEKVDYNNWYMTTGNGFPAACYTIFKLMWYKKHEPDMYKKVYKFLGTKDYINLRLTGEIKTDYSYASGCGAYNLKEFRYEDEFIKAAGLERDTFADIVPSTYILGTLTKSAAQQLNLPPSVKVVCGGVDNSCMALGAKNIEEGRVYTSLGSSAWIAVSSENPVLDIKTKPYVFTHVIPNMFTSAVSIFSAGTTYNWLLDNVCSDLKEASKKEGKDVYLMMNELAGKSPIGANKLLFIPSLAGGTSQDPSVNIRGAYMGLDLKHDRGDLIRACMEGIAMNLRLRLDILKRYLKLQNEMLLVGGGSKSALYRRIFADVYNMKIIKTNIDQDAAALGAAAIAAVGCGIWKDFKKIDHIHKIQEEIYPDYENNQKYEKLLEIFERSVEYQAKISDMLHDVQL